jgi:hypothetical protein
VGAFLQTDRPVTQTYTPPPPTNNICATSTRTPTQVKELRKQWLAEVRAGSVQSGQHTPPHSHAHAPLQPTLSPLPLPYHTPTPAQVKELRKQWLAEFRAQRAAQRLAAEGVAREIEALKAARSADKQHDREKHQLERLLWEAERAVDNVSGGLGRGERGLPGGKRGRSVDTGTDRAVDIVGLCTGGRGEVAGVAGGAGEVRLQPAGCAGYPHNNAQPFFLPVLLLCCPCFLVYRQAERRLASARREAMRQETLSHYRQLW